MLTKYSSPDQIIREGFSQLPQFVAPELQGKVKDELGKVQDYKSFVSTLEGTTGMSNDEAEYVAGAATYGLLEKFGVNPQEWKFAVSPLDLKSLKYGPEEYENARRFYATWTDVAQISLLVASLGALATGGIAAFLAGSTLKTALTAIRAGRGLGAMAEIWNIAKFKGIKWLAIPSAITAIGGAVAMFANSQLSTTGDLVGYLQQGVARGAEAEANAAAGGTGTGSGGSELPKTIIRMVTEHKPQQFIGTLFSSKLGSAEQFERVLDDKITDMNDLEADAKLNLNKWLASLPNRMGYSIVIRKDPVDEYGAQQSGVWATLTMFMTHISGKTTPIDTILLGPVEPQVRLELQRQTKTVENHLSGFIEAATVKEIQIPSGSVDIFNAKNERVGLSEVSVGTAGSTGSGTVAGTGTTTTPKAVVRGRFIKLLNGQLVNSDFASEAVKQAADQGIYSYVVGPGKPSVIYAESINAYEAVDGNGKRIDLYMSEDDAYRAIGQTKPATSAASSPPPATSAPVPTQTPVSGVSANPAAVRAQAATTLFDYYSAYGVSLPSVSRRAALYQGRGLGSAASYTGSAAQNDALLRSLKAENVGADILLGA